jgi:hypothetical protein
MADEMAMFWFFSHLKKHLTLNSLIAKVESVSRTE